MSEAHNMTLEDQVMRDPGGDGEKLCGRRASFRFVHCMIESSNGLLGDVLPFRVHMLELLYVKQTPSLAQPYEAWRRPEYA